MEYSTDKTMQQIWLCMSRDAKSALGDSPLSDQWYTDVATGNYKSMRARTCNHWFISEDPYMVKWSLQLENLFKRYKFKNDLYTEEELASKAVDKFIGDQVRISTPLKLRSYELLVLKVARTKVREILGPYSEASHVDLCQFSRHANTGVPYRDSYLDNKLSVLSGTPGQISWFDNHIKSDDVLRRSVIDCGHRGDTSQWQVSETLTLAKVPKSWKSLRTMLPNTVIGSYYSHGLGEYIRKQLLDAGVNIAKLQMKHRMLARKFSRSRSHVTADLSSASDSFNREILMRLLPLPWYHAIVHGLPRLVEVDGVRYGLQSVMTMGMGHTFPLQTLLFSCLLKAVQQLTDTRGLISVYGDDLIYPRKMHKYVARIFPSFNLRLNLDKTFVTSHFRESCGGDFYRGIDVRPFCPEGTAQRLSRRPYTAYLYKLYNGLRLRWSEFEIPQTLHYIMKELCNVSDVVHQVPPSFPATAGILVSNVQRPGIIPWSPVTYSRSRQSLSFKYISSVQDKRIVELPRIYYWDTLRRLDGHRDTSCLYAGAPSSIAWVKLQHGRKKKWFLTEPKRASDKLISQTGHMSMWS